MQYVSATETESIVIDGIDYCGFVPRTIGQLFEGFDENLETGQVVGLGGKLNIRPRYQREFIYSDEKARGVIETVLGGLPLNNMYWAVKEDGTFEVADGQQRALSICHFIKEKFYIKLDGNTFYFNNLPNELKKRILNYKLQIFEIKGSEYDILRWYDKINTPGATMTRQERRNAWYSSGTWLEAAKFYFSRPKGDADNNWKHLTGGIANRQEILECALIWKVGKDGITDYMAQHCHDKDASDLIEYFEKVCAWVTEVTGGDDDIALVQLGEKWGELYEKYADTFVIDREKIDNQIRTLLTDYEVNEKPHLFYPYIISNGVEKLAVRQFKKSVKKAKWIEQNGICPICGGKFELNDMDADHIIPWSKGGHTVPSNCQCLCKKCNNEKGNFSKN